MSKILDGKQNAAADDGDPRSGIRFGILAKATTAMALAGVIPLVLFAALTLSRESAQTREELELSMQTSAEQISLHVDEWFEKNVRVLKAAASLSALAAMQPEAQVEVLQALQRTYPWMYLVFTIGPDGRNVARSDGKPLTPYADRQYFKDVMGGKEFASETLLGKTSKKAANIIAVPIRDGGGRLVGVLAAAMSVEDISQAIAHWKKGKTGFAFLVDEKAKVVAHPREEFVQSPTFLTSHPLIAEFANNRQPRLITFTETDGRQVIGFVNGTRFGWTVAVQQDESEIFAPIRRTLYVGVAFLAGALALVALLSRLASAILVRPILEMTKAADRMSMGELQEPITSARNDELGLLAQSLDRLRKSMKAAMARLRSSPPGDSATTAALRASTIHEKV